ncbi:hypothetical protein HX057_07435 [Myroides odoratimimus]|uniref:Uncharacterized protein n=2 Tax=Myroides odoratimimus TaxID=76832 RepID=A0ABP2N9K7_9FLAO|nr:MULTISPECIES: hypothetical protein [Myroides]EHO12684.1 hypothetical protein HMPREF9715_01839 [Myroides odoratimimus CIP 101113]EKB07202.1 hypothetical protein HMPREF9711_00512 [Myroides odoratimimus CCUG 3837]EHO08426.1 hypothetical protein HMPREF9712_02088 [Myroides odoratimimus CCUG 10230]EPH12276.1 hypothetical protein HMPREF9713_01117 [Myroides odoratimimus CCUG 12700]MCA4819617.1 hypothetical protein [Myroides odoratimimus]
MKMIWIKTIDISLFLLCTINLILWIMRGLYVIGTNTSETFQWIYEEAYTPMLYALFILPVLVVATMINRKFSIQSFTFLSLKCLVINFFLIFVLR